MKKKAPKRAAVPKSDPRSYGCMGVFQARHECEQVVEANGDNGPVRFFCIACGTLFVLDAR